MHDLFSLKGRTAFDDKRSSRGRGPQQMSLWEDRFSPTRRER